MKVKRNGRTGPRPVRRLSIILGAVAALAAAPISSPAQAEAAAAFAVPHGQTVRDFYKIRQSSPLWFKGGYPTAAAQALVSLLSTAQADGLDPDRYRVDEIRQAIKRA